MSLPEIGRLHFDWSITENGMYGSVKQPFVGRETGSPALKTAARGDYKDGCICEFQLHRNLENHILYGKWQIEEEKYTLQDKAKIIYKKKLTEGTSTQPSLETDVIRVARKDWALKSSKKTKHFDKKQLQYLGEKFKVGQETGRKADPGQVSIDMRHAKDEDGNRLFVVHQFLSAEQIKSYFSRKAAKEKHMESDMDLEQAVAQEEAVAEQEEYSNTRELILRECQLNHPIIYDTYNLCDCAPKACCRISSGKWQCFVQYVNISALMYRMCQ